MIADGYKDTEIGVILVEWGVIELGKVLTIHRGASPRPINEFITENENGISWVKIGDIQKNAKYLVKTKQKITSEGAKKSRAIKPKDFILSNSMSFGRPYISKINGCIHDGWLLLRNKDENILSNSFLYEVLSADLAKKQFKRFAAGSTVNNLKSETVITLKIPLPPLKEQEKISDILSTTDDKIDAIATQIEKAETLKKGLLQKLLSEGIGHNEFKDSELGKIPDIWKVVELPHITDKITSGGTPSRKKAEYFENGTINWIKTGELRDCYIYNSKEKITEDAVANSSAKVFPVDTLLIAMYGATIGRTAYLKTECSTNQACCAIIFNQGIADPYFYWKYFHFIKDNLISQGRGAGQPNISQAIIKTLLIPLPLLKEQKQIAEILSTADEKIEILRAKKEKYETLKKGLLRKLLSGEVRV